jgi:hypothetical protein
MRSRHEGRKVFWGPFQESLPAELQTSLPCIEQIERELAGEKFPQKEDEV